MLYSFTLDEIRSYCRNSIESFETWARRLIYQKMTQKFGDKYYEGKDANGNNLIKKAVRDHASDLMSQNPTRFSRWVDALFIEDLIYVLCHPALYNELFKKALDYMYPQGKEEVREFLTRIIPVRNALSHSNSVSIRQAEQTICYCNDFIDSVKEFYKDEGVDQLWNVPTIISATDSEGSTYTCEEGSALDDIIDTKHSFYINDVYSLMVEIDSSFDTLSYSIEWYEGNEERVDLRNSKKYIKQFSINDVMKTFVVECRLISIKEWHKYRTYDCHKIWILSILPPKD